MLKKLPNVLTLLRVILIPVFVYLIHFEYFFAAGVLFIFASLTDYLDGYLARKYKVITDFGKLMDPLADKILVMAALIMLVGQRHSLTGEPWIPAWMVVMIIAREVWVTGIRGVASTYGMVLPADATGKIKSFLQMFAVSFIIFYDVVLFTLSGVSITAGFIGERLLLVSIVFSYWGAVNYTAIVFSNKKMSLFNQ